MCGYTPLLMSSVCLSSRLQRGYNGVDGAEFQRRELQLRSSSVIVAARHARHARQIHLAIR